MAHVIVLLLILNVHILEDYIMEIWTFYSGERIFPLLSRSGQKETDIRFWGTLDCVRGL